jgi:NAD(P)-dependent dehydrogenase (short-subunit alcohol dehydrogenase family)
VVGGRNAELAALLEDRFRLDDRVAVVTGGGSGLGRASALKFAAAGAQVIVVDINERAAEETAALSREAGGKSNAYACDVSRVSEIKELMASVGDDHGRIDVLLNNAGTPGAPGLDISEDDWDRAVNLNMRSVYYGTVHALPLLRRSQHASIIYTASIAALIGTPRSPIYSMTKAAVVGLMRTVAGMFPEIPIRSNAICPGSFDTPMVRQGMNQSADPEGHLSGVLAKVPMGRLGWPPEFADLALFLASDASSFMTGCVIPLDGGYTSA